MEPRPIPLRLQPLFQPEDLPTVPPTVPPDVPWKKMNLPKLQLTLPKLQLTPPKLQLNLPKLQLNPSQNLPLRKIPVNLRCHHKPDSNPTHLQLSLMILPEQMMIKEGMS